eukprot:COSAG06_NODE_45990_length_350_cov_1.031873_1_plen_39_part_10
MGAPAGQPLPSQDVCITAAANRARWAAAQIALACIAIWG